MRLKAISLLLATGLVTGPAVAQLDGLLEAAPPQQAETQALVDATDPEAIAAILRASGYTATLKRQETGAVEIESRAHDTGFWLYFQACADDFTGCEVVTFSSGFDFETAQLPDIIGNWNAERFSKAYLDEDGDPFVEFSVNMKDGVSRENFVDTLTWFTLEMQAFIEQIGWNSDMGEQARPI